MRILEGYTLTQAAALAGGFTHGPAAQSLVETWVYDSRLPFREEGACFLALTGPSRGGLAFVENAFARGVRLFCLREADYATLQDQALSEGLATYWLVEDPLIALQRLAAAHRKSFQGPVIGITGSNGKTIVKEWLYMLAGGASANLSRSPGSHNSQLGVALSILNIRNHTAAAILEAGISRPGEMRSLATMIEPSLGIFTMLGDAHDAGFAAGAAGDTERTASRRQKAHEKLKLFPGAEALLYGADDHFLHEFIQEWRAARPLGPKLLGWTISPTTRPKNVAEDFTHVRFHGDRVTLQLSSLLQSPGQSAEIELPCPYADTASRENLVHALLASFWLDLRLRRTREKDREQSAVHTKAVKSFQGLSPEILAERIKHLPAGALRLQVYAGRDGIRLVDDSYSADREGFAAAAEFFVQHARAGAERIWIVGPPTESSGTSINADAAFITARAKEALVDRIYVVGAAADWCPDADAAFSDVEEALAALPALHLAGATVLVKGPRALRLERLARALRERSHELRLELELSALAHNIATYRARLLPATRICVMVKAEAYGSGAPEVAAFFAARGVDYLAVANVDEALALRHAGVMLPIIVAHVLAEERRLVIEHNLEPEVSNLQQLRQYARTSAAAVAPWLHLKLDTGMHRLGFDTTGGRESELPALLDELSSGVYPIRSIFSHLSASEAPEGDDFTKQQYERLLATTVAISDRLGYRPWVHLLNSVGAWRLPAYQLDMVRLGLGVYGVGLETIAPRTLHAAHRLVAQIVQIRPVAGGEVVGYGLGGRSDHERRIGVVNVGYADGLRRSAGQGRYALLVDGIRAPIVGSVCMDFTMIDLSDCPAARVGDDVEVFGPGQPVEVLAKACDTIPYEIFTGIGPRVRRVYYR